MKLRAENHVELSVANLRALLADVDDQIAAGKRVETSIYRRINGETVMVSVVSDEDHYTESELADRRSPYLPPEAWAGI